MDDHALLFAFHRRCAEVAGDALAAGVGQHELAGAAGSVEASTLPPASCWRKETACLLRAPSSWAKALSIRKPRQIHASGSGASSGTTAVVKPQPAARTVRTTRRKKSRTPCRPASRLPEVNRPGRSRSDRRATRGIAAKAAAYRMTKTAVDSSLKIIVA